MQMLSYHKTLQAMEATSKQQQEYTNRTIRDLKEQLSRATIENSQQEQLAQAVRKERDRLLREQQAKVMNIVTIITIITLLLSYPPPSNNNYYYSTYCMDDFK